MLGCAGLATIWMAVFDVSNFVSFDDWKVYLLPFLIAIAFIVGRVLWPWVLTLAVAIPVAVVAGFVWLIATATDSFIYWRRRRVWNKIDAALKSAKTA